MRCLKYYCLFWKLKTYDFFSLQAGKITININKCWYSQLTIVVKNPPANVGDKRDAGLIPRLGSSPREGHGHLLQYSCLENPWTEESGKLYSIESQRVGSNWSDLACKTCIFLIKSIWREYHESRMLVTFEYYYGHTACSVSLLAGSPIK